MDRDKALGQAQEVPGQQCDEQRSAGWTADNLEMLEKQLDKRAKLQARKHELDHKDAQLACLLEELGEQRGLCRMLQREYARARDTANSLRRQRNAVVGERDNLVLEMAAFREEIDQLANQGAQKQEEQASMARQLAGLHQTLGQERAATVRVRQQLEGVEAARDWLHPQLEQHSWEVQRLRQQLDAQQAGPGEAGAPAEGTGAADGGGGSNSGREAQQRQQQDEQQGGSLDGEARRLLLAMRSERQVRERALEELQQVRERELGELRREVAELRAQLVAARELQAQGAGRAWLQGEDQVQQGPGRGTAGHWPVQSALAEGEASRLKRRRRQQQSHYEQEEEAPC